MIKNKINSLQLSGILIMMMMASFLGTGLFAVIKATGVDAYLSVLIGGLFGIPLFISFLVLFNYEPNLPLNGKVVKLFGSKIGFIVNLVFSLIAFTMGLVSMFNLTNFITSQFLPETSLLWIGFIFTILIILINFKGIEVISRVCLILICINLILHSLAIFGLIKDFDFSNLKPFLEYGFNRPLLGAIYIVGFNISPIFLLLMVPKNSLVDKENINKFMSGFYIFGIFLMFIVIILCLGNLGIHLASIYQYPEYIVLKNIKLLSFMDRIENIVTIQWIFGLFINLSMVVFFLTNMVKNNCKNKLVPIILSFLILFVSRLAFENNTVFNNFTYNYILFLRIIIIIILTFMTIAVFWTYRKRAESRKF